MPSKKIWAIFIIVAALVAAIIIAFSKDKASMAINYASSLAAGDKVEVPENPDWQKEFGENPSSAPKEELLKQNETVTDIVSRTLISNYVALKESGQLDQTSAQKLIDQTVQFIENSETEFRPISRLQLSVIPDNGKLTIASYGESLGTVLLGKKPADIQSELELFVQVLSSKDETRLAELDKVIAEYDQIGKDLRLMKVPETFVKAHLDITNGILEIISAFRQLRAFNSDPFKGLLALRTYQNGLNLASGALQAAVSFISKNNVVYKQGTGGYYLLYGL